jgi:hypothetical protein
MPGIAAIIVQTCRHVEGMWNLAPNEASSMGLVLGRIAQAMRATMDADKVYTIAMGERFPHVHLMLVARPKETELVGTRLIDSKLGDAEGAQALIRSGTVAALRSALMTDGVAGPAVHHVNLGIRADQVEAETSFLIDVLGYEHAHVPDVLQARGVMWFDAIDGTQVHLSVDPDHRPAGMAHTALHYGDGLAAIRDRLVARGVEHSVTGLAGTALVMCADPAGNRWELRGALLD